jgi:cob(I)alamin adenosyltransferase
VPGYFLMKPEQVAYLDQQISTFNARLEPLKEFILPGGTRTASLAHIARSVCRRAERAVVALHHETPMGPLPQQYLNRLSDLLFILARCLNKAAQHPDSLWRRD